MPGSTSKKVVVLRYDREPLLGTIDPQNYLQAGGIELLSLHGRYLLAPYEEVKSVCFVKNFPEQAGLGGKRAYASRPRLEGLWLRLVFRDGDTLEGLMPNNLLDVAPQGFTLTPPDPMSGNQRLFVPRAALASVQVLGVVGSPRRGARKKPVSRAQMELFE